MILALLACSGSDDTADLPDTTPTDTAPVDTTDSAAPETRDPLSLARLPELEDLDPADGAVRVALTAAPHTHTFTDLDDTTHTVEGFAYTDAGTPLIRLKLGDTLTVDFSNALDEPTTIHWHGIDVPYDMDGVTWTTDPIQPGGSFTYSFTVSQSGTFWFHPHFNTDEQVSGGLYGVIIVEDPADPVVDEDLVLLIDDWDLDEVVSDMDDMEHDHVAAEGTWTVNGQIQPTLTL
ncbi:MAG: FtsP/CotA-like multicopper oxidase with cupredoxin domain, partial [Myxococcota bacterium]